MKTALIVGGSRGIGREIVIKFTQNGYNCAFTYLNSGAEARSLSKNTGAAAFKCDCADYAQTEASCKEILSQLGHVDVLVCNAGAASYGLFTELSPKEWDRLFAVNVKSIYNASHFILPQMISRKSGSVITMSSIWGEAGASCEAAYSAAKAAVIGLTKALAKELGPSGIRVNCISPGVINTQMLHGFSPEDLNELAAQSALGRIGTPDEVANAALFLASTEAGFITGQVLGVDGLFNA
ncbi:MAG: SDR family oxidoreductase [Oscillospiraceae bacterium]|jgi:3-oxoacyl-[acyl-carrier protein] reductase|nr:SDR family oxidoreductase [Oscillospiraceae bacterium]